MDGQRLIRMGSWSTGCRVHAARQAAQCTTAACMAAGAALRPSPCQRPARGSAITASAGAVSLDRGRAVGGAPPDLRGGFSRSTSLCPRGSLLRLPCRRSGTARSVAGRYCRAQSGTFSRAPSVLARCDAAAPVSLGRGRRGRGAGRERTGRARSLPHAGGTLRSRFRCLARLAGRVAAPGSLHRAPARAQLAVGRWQADQPTRRATGATLGLH